MTLIETLRVDGYTVLGSGGLLVDSERLDELAAGRLRANASLKINGTGASIPRDREAWPAVWLTRTGYPER